MTASKLVDPSKTPQTPRTQTARDRSPGRPDDRPGDHDDGRDDGQVDAEMALQAALDKKALEPVLLDVRGICSYANYILMVSGRSDRQVDAIADGVLAGMRTRGQRPLGVEGKGSGQWVLIDFGDLITHVFHHPVREHYDLESLWIDAKRVPIEIPSDARIPAEDAYG